MLNDLRFALRQLRNSPGFTFVAVLTLALGIGANTAIFSVIYAVLLRPLPYPEADRLAILTESDANQPQISISFPDYVDWKRDNTTFKEIAISRRESYNLSGLEGRAPEQVSGALVTANFFKVIGLEAATRPCLHLGRRSSRRATPRGDQRSVMGAGVCARSQYSWTGGEFWKPALHHRWGDAAGDVFAAHSRRLVPAHAADG